jgi:hypothetical protein
MNRKLSSLSLFYVLSRRLLGRTGENKEILSQDRRYPGRYDVIIIVFHHEFRSGRSVSVSDVISSSSLLSGRPGPFG